MKRLTIIGSRGIPARYGGFETLAEHLARQLHGEKILITVIGEQPEVEGFGGVYVRKTSFSKRRYPVLYYLESVFRAMWNTDVVLHLGVGGGPFLFLLRWMRIRVVTNVDGMEHQRAKYSALKKTYVRFAQAMTARWSDHLVADAEAVREYWMHRWNIPDNRITVIRYGAPVVKSAPRIPLLPAESYYLLIARIVPENNIHLILDAFEKSGSVRSLVIIGNWMDSAYGMQLRQCADSRIILLDPVYDTEAVQSYRFHCFTYLHGHSVGGTNPTLVEALGCGCLTVCYDNVFNRETTHQSGWFFQDVESLVSIFRQLDTLDDSTRNRFRETSYALAESWYAWETVATTYETILC